MSDASDSDAPNNAARAAAITTGAIGVTFSLGGYALYGGPTGRSIAVGTFIAVVNLLALRAVVQSLVRASDGDSDGADSTEQDHRREGRRGGIAWGLFGLLKMLVLFGGIWILLAKHLLDPIALVVGYGALPMGIAASALFTSLRPGGRRPR